MYINKKLPGVVPEHDFGDADAEFIGIEFWQPFFVGLHPEADAFFMWAEHAVAQSF